MGFDQPRSLGSRETGAAAALPIWIAYMGKVLKGLPEATYNVPDGIVTANINDAGQLDSSSPRLEYFYKEIPTGQARIRTAGIAPSADIVKDQLF